MTSVNKYTNRRGSPHIDMLPPLPDVQASKGETMLILPPIHKPHSVPVKSYSENRLLSFKLQNEQKKLLMTIM